MAERCVDDDDDDLRRRCAVHDQWAASHPEGVAFAEAWADQAFELIGGVTSPSGELGTSFNMSQ